MKSKALKGVLALALTLVLVGGMTTTVFAEGEDSASSESSTSGDSTSTTDPDDGSGEESQTPSSNPGRNSGQVISSLGEAASTMTYEEIVQAVLNANAANTVNESEETEATPVASVSDDDVQVPEQPAEDPVITAFVETLQEASIPAGGKTEIGGRSVVSSAASMILAKSVPGVAIVTPVEELAANLSLSDQQTAFIRVYDTDQKKSSLAMASAQSAIDALGGGTIVSSLQVNLGAKEKGKVVELSSGEAGMVIGLPRAADKEKSYCVIQVLPGGEVNVLEDQDEDPATVSFPVRAGLGTYVLVAQ